MNMRLWFISLAFIFALLIGCGSETNTSITDEHIDQVTAKVTKALEKTASGSASKLSDLKRACNRLRFLDSKLTLDICNSQPDKVVSEYKDSDSSLIERYSDEVTLKELATSTVQEIGAEQRKYSAELIVQYWDWITPIKSELQSLQGSINRAVKSRELEKLPYPASYAVLSDRTRIELAKELEKQKNAIRRYASIEDPLTPVTIADIEKQQGIFQQISSGGLSSQAIRNLIREDLVEDKWSTDLQKSLDTPNLSGLRNLSRAASDRVALDSFLEKARILDEMRTNGVRNPEIELPTFNDDAAEELVSDCDAVLSLDEGAFDEICGAIGDILESALTRVEQRLSGGETALTPPGSSGPSNGPDGDINADVTSHGALKARLRSIVAELDTTARPSSVPIEGLTQAYRPELVQNLRARIDEASKVYVQAVYHWNFIQLANAEARLELLQLALSKASGAPLPEGVSKPFSLLAPEDAKQALHEWARLERTLARTRSMFPHDPAIEIATESAGKIVLDLQLAVEKPATNADFAAVLHSADEGKLKVALTASDTTVSTRTASYLKQYKDKFAALPVRFDEWRGPRGPPTDDNFPRSRKLAATLESLGRDPLKFIESIALLHAEHAEFYRALEGADDVTRQRWEFGKGQPLAWIMAQLAPADLARIVVYIARVDNSTSAAQLANGWPELTSATHDIHDAAHEESNRRKKGIALVALGAPRNNGDSPKPDGDKPPRGPKGHPPHYPPSGHPGLSKVAEKYTMDVTAREATSLERQKVVEIAQRMYSTADSMPGAVKDKVSEIINSQIQSETVRLGKIIDALFGIESKMGLLEISARATEQVAPELLTAQEKAKDHTAMALLAMMARITQAEKQGYSRVDAERWKKLNRWLFILGRGPPPSDVAKAAVDPKRPLDGSGGAKFAFKEVTVDANFLRAEKDLAVSEAQLAVAESLEKTASLTPKSIGSESGRTVASRTNWQASEFNFEKMDKGGKLASQTRYPQNMGDWRGLFVASNDDTIKNKSFDFEKYVKNASNFRGIGGGIHFGSVAEPKRQAILHDVQAGARLFYEESKQALVLETIGGMRYVYGPIEPRALKAIYSYVSSYPGINLAVTIGAAGDTTVVREDGQTPVLLDPSFVDNPVGQALYLADTIPWQLHEGILPNGTTNPAKQDFEIEYQQYKRDSDAETDKLKSMLMELNVRRLSNTDPSEWRNLTASRDDMTDMLRTLVSTSSEYDFKSKFSLLIKTRASQTKEAREIVENLKANANSLRHQGFTASHVRAAAQRMKQNNYLLDLDKFLNSPQYQQGILQHPQYQQKMFRPYQQIMDPLVRELTEYATKNKISADDLELYAKAMEAKSDDLAYLVINTEGINKHVNSFAEYLFKPGMTQDLRVMDAVKLAAEHQENETRYSRSLLKFAASAILEKLKSDVVSQAAQYLPSELGSTTTLATLFDDEIGFDLSGGKIKFESRMRYTYSTVDYRITETGELVFKHDSSDDKKPFKAKQLTGMTEAATRNFERLTQVFQPLADVRRYAEVAAFLRWAVCPNTRENRCRGQDGLSIDFSVLGKYRLRDRKLTPTPDAERRKPS